MAYKATNNVPERINICIMGRKLHENGWTFWSDGWTGLPHVACDLTPVKTKLMLPGCTIQEIEMHLRSLEEGGGEGGAEVVSFHMN